MASPTSHSIPSVCLWPFVFWWVLFAAIKQFRTVLSISNSLTNAPMHKESVLQSMVIAVYDVLECERVSVFLINEDDSNRLDLAITADSDFRSEFPKVAFELRSQGIASFVARSGETLNIPDAYAEPRFNPNFDQRTGFRTRTILCVPMVNAAGQVGCSSFTGGCYESCTQRMRVC